MVTEVISNDFGLPGTCNTTTICLRSTDCTLQYRNSSFTGSYWGVVDINDQFSICFSGEGCYRTSTFTLETIGSACALKYCNRYLCDYADSKCISDCVNGYCSFTNSYACDFLEYAQYVFTTNKLDFTCNGKHLNMNTLNTSYIISDNEFLKYNAASNLLFYYNTRSVLAPISFNTTKNTTWIINNNKIVVISRPDSTSESSIFHYAKIFVSMVVVMLIH